MTRTTTIPRSPPISRPFCSGTVGSDNLVGDAQNTAYYFARRRPSAAADVITDSGGLNQLEFRRPGRHQDQGRHRYDRRDFRQRDDLERFHDDRRQCGSVEHFLRRHHAASVGRCLRGGARERDEQRQRSGLRAGLRRYPGDADPWGRRNRICHCRYERCRFPGAQSSRPMAWSCSPRAAATPSASNRSAITSSSVGSRPRTMSTPMPTVFPINTSIRSTIAVRVCRPCSGPAACRFT